MVWSEFSCNGWLPVVKSERGFSGCTCEFIIRRIRIVVLDAAAPVAQVDRVSVYGIGSEKSESPPNKALTKNDQSDLVEFLASKDLDLAKILKAWPDLSIELRRVIVKMVK